jgi:hypothetical protein
MAGDLGRWGQGPEVQHYGRDLGLLKALKRAALLNPVQRGAAPQIMPREGKDQGDEQVYGLEAAD